MWSQSPNAFLRTEGDRHQFNNCPSNIKSQLQKALEIRILHNESVSPGQGLGMLPSRGECLNWEPKEE
jgi:hypothetical protein